MNVYILLPLVFLVAFSVQTAYAQVEHGQNYDKQILKINEDGTQTVKHTILSYDRVNHLGAWHDYVFTDYGDYLELKTATNSIRLDVVTCGFSFYNNDGVKLFGDSIVAFNSIVNQYSWNQVTQVNNAACEAYYDEGEKALVAKKYAAGVGFMEYKYIFDNGKWKTQLEATNLTSLTNRVFAFDQTIDLNRDTIHFGKQQRNLDNFNGTTFDRTWLENNEGKVVDFLNNFSFDLDLGFDYLSSVTVTDTGFNKSKLTFHYMRNNEVLMPNETLIIDPTFSAIPTSENALEASDATPSTCSGKTYSGLTGTTRITYDATICRIPFFSYNIASVPTSAVVSSATWTYDIITSTSITGNCYPFDFTNNPTGPQGDYDAVFTAAGIGTPTNGCTTLGTGKVFTMNSTGIAKIQDNISTGAGFYALGVWFVTEPVTTEAAFFQTGDATLEFVYTDFPRPDAVDDLESPSQSYGTVDLLWTLPALNNGTCSGHQINYSTPWGNPNTIAENNTGSCTTSATVSGLEIGTDYTFGVSVWTENGNNATKPPMLWLNVTTAGNFTIGTAVFNQTNSEILPITFEEQEINSTAKFLNVTYANTFTLDCDFSYQFANNNKTYSNLTGYAVSSTLDETYFILTDFENEIINVNCHDTVTDTDAEYLMTQSDFPLLEQIRNFRNGTYGTMGAFGAFDFVTIAVVIFSMIGLNRVNESVGAIFNIILLGVLAYFEIIELPTIIFGALTVVIIFVITSTRKD